MAWNVPGLNRVRETGEWTASEISSVRRADDCVCPSRRMARPALAQVRSEAGGEREV